MFVLGTGPPLVLIPGIQGRWQWMRPAVRALAERFRVITFSLDRLPRRRRADGASLFDLQVDQVIRALNAAGAERAVICGVSYGGLVAVRVAATRAHRVSALVLASAPAAAWRPDERVTRYAAAPWLSAPAFFLGARDRLTREIAVARPDLADRYRTMAGYLCEIALHPPSPVAMARRARAVAGCDLVTDAKAITAPTLVITGDEQLDRVVPVAGTREYLSLIRGSTGFTLRGTGHIGLVTKPQPFARAIAAFVFAPPGAQSSELANRQINKSTDQQLNASSR
jgi:pimeloyl-ACP methyl ester carboxylesterase